MAKKTPWTTWGDEQIWQLDSLSPDELINRIVLLARVRRLWLQQHRAMENRILAIERWRDGRLKGKRKVVISEESRAFAAAILPQVAPGLQPWVAEVHQRVLAYERVLSYGAQLLPVWKWARQVKGVSALGLALLIGETGDLSEYSCPSKLWKRLGLAVIDGQAQRRVKGIEEGTRHGFNPRRRAVSYLVGVGLRNQNDGEYRALYDARKTIEQAKSEKGADNRAMRYMTKRFLLHLWCVWNGKALEIAA